MITMTDPNLLTADEKSHIRSNIEQVLSDILTDKYGDEYGVKITIRFNGGKAPDKPAKKRKAKELKEVAV